MAENERMQPEIDTLPARPFLADPLAPRDQAFWGLDEAEQDRYRAMAQAARDFFAQAFSPELESD